MYCRGFWIGSNKMSRYGSSLVECPPVVQADGFRILTETRLSRDALLKDGENSGQVSPVVVTPRLNIFVKRYWSTRIFQNWVRHGYAFHQSLGSTVLCIFAGAEARISATPFRIWHFFTFCLTYLHSLPVRMNTERRLNNSTWPSVNYGALLSIVADPWHFGTDTDPWIHSSD